MRRRIATAIATFGLVIACGGTSTSTSTSTTVTPTTTTAAPSSSTTTTAPSTSTTTSTSSSPTSTLAPSNIWLHVFIEATAPSGWTVEPCPDNAPLLCIEHDGLTSTVRLDDTPVGTSDFDDLLTASGVAPDTTDLGTAAAHPGIMRALESLASLEYDDYVTRMKPAYPDWTPTLDPPTVVPVGALLGYRFGMGIEDDTGAVIARSVRFVTFDGFAMWMVTAEFDPSAPDGGGFSDMTTLDEIDPYLTLMVRDLTLAPALAGYMSTTLLLPSASDFGTGWTQKFLIPYGPSDAELGTAPGGDAGSLDLGPEFGAEAADGTWWILDSAKRRFAHFSAEGGYLGDVVIDPQFLVKGELVQWRLPHALDDGSVVTTELHPDGTGLLVLRDGKLTAIALSDAVSPKLDDGQWIYGLARGGAMARIDVAAGRSETVDWLVTRAGTRFALWVSRNAVTVWLPDAPAPNIHRLELQYAPDPDDRIFVSLEAAGGPDGELYLYFLGGTDSGAGGQLAGFLRIDADGTVGSIEPTRGPNVMNDPGSPGHLGSSPTTGRAWLMFIEEDGVRVFERA